MRIDIEDIIDQQVLGSTDSKEPWDNYNQNEVYFKPNKILADRWDKVYDYRLLVIDANSHAIIQTSGNPALDAVSTFNFYSLGGEAVNIDGALQQWEFILPITPQSLSIDDQYSIVTTPTLRGIIEEHNGVKFRMISVSTTTGVWRERFSLDQPESLSSTGFGSLIKDVFANTIESATNIANSFNSLTSILDGSHPKSNNAINYEITGDRLKTTGYYKALQLQQFIEQYAIAKKDPKNRNWRLVFDMPKLNQSYVVTPMAFSLKKSSEKPNEHSVSFQLKAWKRIDLNSTGFDIPPNIRPLSDPGFLTGTLNKLHAARNVLGDVKNLVQAAKGDILAPFEILRQATLFIKDLAGVAVSVIDLSKDLISGDLFKSALKDALANLNSAKLQLESSLSDKENSAISSSKKFKIVNEGQPFQAQAISSKDLDPALNSLFEDPDRFPRLLALITMDNLNLGDDLQEQVEQQTESVRDTTVATINEWKENLLSLTESLAVSLGASDTASTRSIPMSVDEYEILNVLYEVIQSFDSLTARKTIDDNRIARTSQDNLLAIGGVPDSVDINTITSKLLVPVPYKATIEEISARYLNDPDRWNEIAELNNLREPYIDETGVTLNLTSNAESRSFNILRTNLFIGQKITLSSDIVQPFIRKIINIKELGETSLLVTVDGLANLDSLKLVNNAKMKAYLPGTVNSQNQIFIPSTQQAMEDDRTFIPFQYKDNQLVAISKIDFLLDETGDLALDANGDVKLAAGITNLNQAFKMKLLSAKGSIMRNPSYGLGLEPGVMGSDLDLGVLAATFEDMIKDDPRFTGYDKAELVLNGPKLQGNFKVRIASNGGILPASYILE